MLTAGLREEPEEDTTAAVHICRGTDHTMMSLQSLSHHYTIHLCRLTATTALQRSLGAKVARCRAHTSAKAPQSSLVLAHRHQPPE